MFYTKYRPQKFSEISRPNEAADALVKEVLSDKVAHAYLFVGPRGTGKTSTARILAKALNCSNLSKTGDPCDACDACESIKKGSYLDLIEIDAASNRGIDDIRELKNKIKLAPVSGKFKIYIIDEVHMLTSEAFNALLKTLEEPPKNTVFILCTTELHKVPETIKSRCQVFKFKRATLKQLMSKLSYIAKEEGIKVTEKDIEHIARASLGGFRDAETMLQQLAEGEVTLDALLNVGSREKYVELTELLVANNAKAALTLINKVFDEGVDLYVWTGEFVKHLRDLLLMKSGITEDVLELPEELTSEIKSQVAVVKLEWLQLALDVFSEAQSKIKFSFLPQLPLELAVVKMCNPLSFVPPALGRPQPSPNPIKGNPFAKSTPVKSEAVSETKLPTSLDSADGTTEYPNDAVEAIVGEPTLADLQEDIAMDISIIQEKWSSVIEKVDKINKSIHGLLISGKPIAIEGRFVILGVSYSFHKERIEAPKNRLILEQVLSEIFDSTLSVKCVVTEEKPKSKSNEVGVLTDYNVVMIDKSAVIDMLDGGLPL